MRKPEYYRCPLRTRSDITDFIFDVTEQRSYHYTPYPFCFNVKAYDVDFSFENLLKHWRNAEGNPFYTHASEWQAACKELLEEHSDHLWDWAIEDCCSHFVSNMKDGSLGSDCYTHLWGGKKIDVEYSLQGRGGGWLSIDKFGDWGFTIQEFGIEHLRNCMEGRYKDEQMDYQTLRDLYQLVVILKHDLQSDKIEHEIEYQAAFTFFANICSDIPQPQHIQTKIVTGV